MEKRKNILFIVPNQYGYNTGYFYYCELLAKQHNVFYIGVNQGKPVVDSSAGVNVIYVNDCNKELGNWRLKINKVLRELNSKHNFDKIITFSYNLCSLQLLVLPRRKCIMDIRTSFIKETRLKTIISNVILYLDSMMFSKVSVISRGVGCFMRIPLSKTLLLPIGANVEPYIERKDFNDKLSLLYVGTFYDRNIEKTIEGVALFRKHHPEVPISYTIIGMGSEREKELIGTAIKNNDLGDIVVFVGEKRYEQLKPYYNSHNIGVSYVPLTKYYDCQPPTKTFEYLVKGMLVMCTPTSENAMLTNKENGVLLKSDSVEDFANGIEYLYSNMSGYNSRVIYEDSQKYSWENITKEYIYSIINN